MALAEPQGFALAERAASSLSRVEPLGALLYSTAAHPAWAGRAPLARPLSAQYKYSMIQFALICLIALALSGPW